MAVTPWPEVSMNHTPKTKRPLGLTRAHQQVKKLTSLRQEQRDTRQYAEAWYQALRGWQVIYPTVTTPSISYAAFRASGSVETLTSGEVSPFLPTYLSTPSGELSEAQVARAITEMTLSRIPGTVQLGRMLDRLRHQDNGSMESLLRGTAWSQHKERALRYAVAVLTLAVRLDDVEAERPLQQVTTELSQTKVVNAVQNC
ncbi:hypothetical protein GCM10008955_00890 [Deinococcus malanensis]|uniref:Uncharacterized protein n=2 Tax=Deinococcus malanensis TaxID=1706855 RepID=A0ABQ2EJ58_9DEIO|nr:hypothetical protein GCM10008955_00890 [Deinococcus malanensis]